MLSRIFLMTARLSKKVLEVSLLKYIPEMNEKNFVKKVLTST